MIDFDVVHREIISPCILGPENNDIGKEWVIDLDVVYGEIISPCIVTTTISGRDGWVNLEVVHSENISPCIVELKNNDIGKV